METFKAFCLKISRKAFNSDTVKDVRIGAVVVIPIILVVELVFAGPNPMTELLGRTLLALVIFGVLSAVVGAFIRGFLESKSDHVSAMDEDEQANAGDDD